MRKFFVVYRVYGKCKIWLLRFWLNMDISVWDYGCKFIVLYVWSIIYEIYSSF